MWNFKKMAAALAASLFVSSGAFGAGYEFEGVGGRQVSRAGAAIADATDWTAIYWNPGLIAPTAQKQGAEVGLELFGGEAYTRDSNSLTSIPGVGPFNKGTDHSKSLLGAIGFLVPIGSNTGFGAGFYTPLLQGADFMDQSAAGQIIDLENSAGILVWNVSISHQFHPRFSAGAGLNILYGELSSDLTVQNFLLAGNTTVNNTDGSGTGFEGIFGVQFKAHEKLSFGAVYRTGADVKLKGDSTVNNSSVLIPDEKSDFSFDLRHPPTAGVGAAYTPTDRLTLTFDVNRTFWNRFTNQIVYDTPGTLLVNAGNTFDWRNSWKIRLGSKFDWTDRTQFLFGWSYDTGAIDAGSVDFATAIDVPLHRFAGGWAQKWTDRFESIAGVIAGAGTRNEGGVNYRLGGYQLMVEGRFGFGRHS